MNTVSHRQVFYSGRVQGVGFRYTVKQIAQSYEVIGWVRNLPDGRVELQAGGNAEEVEKFFQTIARGPLARYIKGVQCADIPPFPAGAHGFAIRP